MREGGQGGREGGREGEEMKEGGREGEGDEKREVINSHRSNCLTTCSSITCMWNES